MKKALVNVGMIVAAVLVLWGAVHVFLRPVNPEQKTPSGHFASACWACHFVSSGAKIVTE
jgi:hypothetical protein